MADWVGRAAFLLRPVHERLSAILKISSKLFAVSGLRRAAASERVSADQIEELVLRAPGDREVVLSSSLPVVSLVFHWFSQREFVGQLAVIVKGCRAPTCWLQPLLRSRQRWVPKKRGPDHFVPVIANATANLKECS